MKFHKTPRVDPEYFSVISLFANSRIKLRFKLVSPVVSPVITHQDKENHDLLNKSQKA